MASVSDTTEKECCAREAVVSAIPGIYAAIYCLWNHDLGGSPAIYVRVDDRLAASLMLPVLEDLLTKGRAWRWLSWGRCGWVVLLGQL